MIINIIFAVIIIAIGYTNPFLIILGILWGIAPFLCWKISKENIEEYATFLKMVNQVSIPEIEKIERKYEN